MGPSVVCLLGWLLVAGTPEAEAALPQSLFDGKSLGRWEVIQRFEFREHGKVEVRDGRLVLGAGRPGTAVRWTGDFPKMDYEITLEAMRADGDDFFCGLTFPVGKSSCSLILGGWDGSVGGLSMIDGELAVDNETAFHLPFENGQWYRIRLRVTRAKIEAWIDGKKAVDLATGGRLLSIRFPEQVALPLSVATWRTTGALRYIRVLPIGGGGGKTVNSLGEKVRRVGFGVRRGDAVDVRPATSKIAFATDRRPPERSGPPLRCDAGGLLRQRGVYFTFSQ